MERASRSAGTMTRREREIRFLHCCMPRFQDLDRTWRPARGTAVSQAARSARRAAASATLPVGLVSGHDESHPDPASGRPTLLVTMSPLRMVVISAQMSVRIREFAAAPQASDLVHVGNDQVIRQPNLRCANWAGPDLNAPREVHPLRKLLSRAGASR